MQHSIDILIMLPFRMLCRVIDVMHWSALSRLLAALKGAPFWQFKPAFVVFEVLTAALCAPSATASAPLAACSFICCPTFEETSAATSWACITFSTQEIRRREKKKTKKKKATKVES
jgi:hypothetical protein